MDNQTKNIITRESVKKELYFLNAADVRSTLVVCGCLSLFCAPLTAGIVYGFFTLIDNLWLKIILSVLVGGLTSAPIWLNLLLLRTRLKERKLLQNGNFDIVIREVKYKDEKGAHRYRVKILHFVGFKEKPVINVNYDPVTQGDEFYIVHYNGLKEIKLLYSLKMYELKEK